MDPPDVEMEPAQPQPQPPPAAPALATGEGWSMLSRARALLEEGKPSLALQAVRPLSVSLPRSVSILRDCVLCVRLHHRRVMGWGIAGVYVAHLTRRRLIDRSVRRSLRVFSGSISVRVVLSMASSRLEASHGESGGDLGVIRSRS